FPFEQDFPTCAGGLVITSRCRLRRRYCQLVEVKGCQFGSKLIRSSVRVVGAAFGGDRKRGFVTETCIIECARAMHFSSANVGVPVGDGPEPRPGMKIPAGQAISRRNQSAGSLPIGSEAFTVFIQFGIKTARTPACKNLLHGRYIYAKQVGERL